MLSFSPRFAFFLLSVVGLFQAVPGAALATDFSLEESAPLNTAAGSVADAVAVQDGWVLATNVWTSKSKSLTIPSLSRVSKDGKQIWQTSFDSATSSSAAAVVPLANGQGFALVANAARRFNPTSGGYVWIAFVDATGKEKRRVELGYLKYTFQEAVGAELTDDGGLLIYGKATVPGDTWAKAWVIKLSADGKVLFQQPTVWKGQQWDASAMFAHEIGGKRIILVVGTPDNAWLVKYEENAPEKTFQAQLIAPGPAILEMTKTSGALKINSASLTADHKLLLGGTFAWNESVLVPTHVEVIPDSLLPKGITHERGDYYQEVELNSWSYSDGSYTRYENGNSRHFKKNLVAPPTRNIAAYYEVHHHFATFISKRGMFDEVIDVDRVIDSNEGTTANRPVLKLTSVRETSDGEFALLGDRQGTSGRSQWLAQAFPNGNLKWFIELRPTTDKPAVNLSGQKVLVSNDGLVAIGGVEDGKGITILGVTPFGQKEFQLSNHSSFNNSR